MPSLSPGVLLKSLSGSFCCANPESKKLYEAEVKGKDLLFDEQGKFLKEEKD